MILGKARIRKHVLTALRQLSMTEGIVVTQIQLNITYLHTLITQAEKPK